MSCITAAPCRVTAAAAAAVSLSQRRSLARQPTTASPSHRSHRAVRRYVARSLTRRNVSSHRFLLSSPLTLCALPTSPHRSCRVCVNGGCRTAAVNIPLRRTTPHTRCSLDKALPCHTAACRTQRSLSAGPRPHAPQIVSCGQPAQSSMPASPIPRLHGFPVAWEATHTVDNAGWGCLLPSCVLSAHSCKHERSAVCIAQVTVPARQTHLSGARVSSPRRPTLLRNPKKTFGAALVLGLRTTFCATHATDVHSRLRVPTCTGSPPTAVWRVAEKRQRAGCLKPH